MLLLLYSNAFNLLISLFPTLPSSWVRLHSSEKLMSYLVNLCIGDGTKKLRMTTGTTHVPTEELPVLAHMETQQPPWAARTQNFTLAIKLAAIP